MFRKTNKKVVHAVLSLAVLSALATPEIVHGAADTAQEKEGYELENGVTEPIYSYQDAITETIYVESTMDSDRDGDLDRIAVDIIRPLETEDNLSVPIIMDASPYYEGLGRGNESEIKDPDHDGVNEMFPLFYDNYFVPRGYAVVQVDMVGTNNSDGCPPTGGEEETESVNVVINWLNGKGKAWNEAGEEIEADWSTGQVGMIGKSYDGTLANAAAASGVEGLETIVPIGAISSWYDYYRYGGTPFYTNGPGNLSRLVTSSERVEDCAVVREEMRLAADDETGDYNAFWDERNFVKNADQVEASVFAIHGINDYNVKANHFSNWWEALAENDVPRKLWLTQTGHVDPFDFRRSEWVDTLHQWFDYWLLDIDNGIMDDPVVDIERAADEWETQSAWPNEMASAVNVRFAPASETLPGTWLTSPLLDASTQSFTDDPYQTEQQMVENAFNSKENRLLFLSPELGDEVHLSGVPELKLDAIVDKENTHLTALVVDYGVEERVDHRDRGEGIRTLDSESCWGESSESDDACYKETEKTTVEAPYEIVTHGWMDAQNWESLSTSNPLIPGNSYSFEWEALPEDYIFKEGHRIGIVIAASDDRWLIPDNNRATFDVSLGESTISFPVVGGKNALDNALGYKGGTSPENAGDMKEIVDYYLDNGAFSNPGISRAVQAHIRAVEQFERKERGDKVIKHLENLKELLDNQKNNNFLTDEAYLVLTADANTIIEKWK